MDYLKHLSASGQLRFLLEKDTLQLSFLKNKTEGKKKRFLVIIIIIYVQNAPEISFHLK